MSTINRNRLSHGTKLVPEALNTSIRASALKVSAGTLEKTNLSVNSNNFYVHWNIPVIRSSWGEDPSGKIEVPFPFVLPPTQDQWDANFHSNSQKIILEEFSFSFDQQENPVASTDFFDANEFPGLIYPGAAENYTVRLRLYEKTPTIISGDSTAMSPDMIVYQMDISSLLFSSVKHRSNPIVQSDLNISINPYKTYIMTVSFPTGLIHSYTVAATTQNRNAMLPNTNIRAKFRSALLPSDYSQDISTQNIPTVHLGVNTNTPGFTSPIWTAGDAISANNANTGIQTKIEELDDYAVKGYKGGLTQESDVRPNAVISDGYAYDVITLPLFQNLESIRRGMIKDAYRCDFLPYVKTNSVDPKWILDRRRVTIPYPYSIHSAFCSLSFYSNITDIMLVGSGTAAAMRHNTDVYPGVWRATASEISREVGVFIGTGIRSDHYDLQQVAYCQMDPAYSAFRIDSVQMTDEKGDPSSWGSVSALAPTTRISSPDAELWQVPLNDGVLRTPKSFTENGLPFFCGQGNLRTQARENSYDLPYAWGGAAASTPSNCKGAEQWLEVRGKISDPVALGRFTGDSSDLYHETVIGKGGWVIYLIVKRALV